MVTARRTASKRSDGDGSGPRGSDGDGLLDPAEDADRDGVLDAGETSPNSADTDEDGLWDGHDVVQALALAAAMPDVSVMPMADTIHGELDAGTNPQERRHRRRYPERRRGGAHRHGPAAAPTRTRMGCATTRS